MILLSVMNFCHILSTTYLKKAIDHLKANGGFDENLLEHIAPPGWEHINFLGEYTFDVNNLPESTELGPLNIGN